MEKFAKRGSRKSKLFRSLSIVSGSDLEVPTSKPHKTMRCPRWNMFDSDTALKKDAHEILVSLHDLLGF